MADIGILDPLTDHENRCLVHMLTALREHLKDEVEYICDEDDTLSVRSMMRLHAHAYDRVSALMAQVHAEEAATVDPEGHDPQLATEQRYWATYDPTDDEEDA